MRSKRNFCIDIILVCVVLGIVAVSLVPLVFEAFAKDDDDEEDEGGEQAGGKGRAGASA